MLNKYHKQKKSKDFLKKYKKINDTYELGLNIKNDFELIQLSIFETFLNQKQFFENQFESVRNDCFDMWDYLSFYEKNDLILIDTKNKLKGLKSFVHDDVIIYMPYFDTLLNSLYATEIAILERPQFFKLYTEFKNSLIEPKIYGLKPYKAGFSYCRFILEKNETVILFDEDLKIFYKLNDHFEKYPLDLHAAITHDQIDAISDMLVYDKHKELEAYLVNESLVSKRYTKKYLRIQKRKESKQRKEEKKHGNK